jgi:tRNA pseudouridine32 synthase / 23S rRNA pseudouridine746 synthase
VRRKAEAPLPVRDGLGPARVRVRGGVLADEFGSRFGDQARAKVLAGEVVTADGTPADGTTELAAGDVVYLYRDLREEIEVPFEIPILYSDDDLVVVDKPHFLATMPRGSHVAQTALVRLRRQLGLAELSPAHRLDRLTAGVLMFTTRREIRGAYQTLFAQGLIDKTYIAAAVGSSTVALPTVISNRIVKRRGMLQAAVESGEPNAETVVEHAGRGTYQLTPRTGRTHQLRVHMCGIGLPIVNDPLYPQVCDVAAEDFSRPLALIAQSLEFDDPLSGVRHRFVSDRQLLTD